MSKCNLNQWKNTRGVLNRYSQQRQKSKRSFFTFDIIDFYPSISDKRLNKSIELAWIHRTQSIGISEYETIMHSRWTLLYDYKGNMWTKKERKKQFDDFMGAFDGAEVIHFVGIGRCRDDGLAVSKNGNIKRIRTHDKTSHWDVSRPRPKHNFSNQHKKSLFIRYSSESKNGVAQTIPKT